MSQVAQAPKEDSKKFSAARNCCFTLNNYTEAEWFAILAWKCDYLVVGKEVGEEGTPHLQGYVEWTSPKKWSTLKNINDRIHWEKRIGTAKQASDYCKKDGNFHEAGEISNQGERGDLHEVWDYIKAQRPTIDEVMMMYPIVFLKYAKSLTTMVTRMRTSPRSAKPIVVWLWGASGVGKTRAAVSITPDTYMKDNSMWWDNYSGQRVVVYDDFNPPNSTTNEFRSFLKEIDRYVYQGPVKGGYVNINSAIMVITCEFAPRDRYMDNALVQVERRIDHIIEMKADTEVDWDTLLQLV